MYKNHFAINSCLINRYLCSETTAKRPILNPNKPTNMNKEKPIVENIVIADGENGKLFVHCPENQEGEYIIPDGITAIAPLAFKNCAQLESIIIPNSVTYIGHHAFEGCVSIEEVRFPMGIEVIEEGTFMGCTNLSLIAIPPSVKRIEKNAFRECSQLESGVYDYCFDYNLWAEGVYANIIPSSVETIGDNAFRGCTSIEYLTIPFGVTSLGKNAFGDCRNLKEIQILGSVTEIGANVFSGCNKLRKIYAVSMGDIVPLLSPQLQAIIEPMLSSEQLDNVLDELQDRYSSDGATFLRCPKHTVKYTIPEGVEKIGDNAFSECKILDSVIIPKTITEIGVGAFSGCEHLTRLLLPDSVVSIGKNAFYGCLALKEIYIPKGSKEKFEKLLPKHLHDKLKELKQ